MLVAKHLIRKERTNLGSFYTPSVIVEKAKELLFPFFSANTVVIDPEGGYGAFIRFELSISQH
ncbi:MAG: hypothetical protein RMI35_01700 [Leptospiraceae bacterium]|nr:hypothetical protein [Leptospiraceae bacterium]